MPKYKYIFVKQHRSLLLTKTGTKQESMAQMFLLLKKTHLTLCSMVKIHDKCKKKKKNNKESRNNTILDEEKILTLVKLL